MATLQPPFYSSNMLALATKVSRRMYDSICHSTHTLGRFVLLLDPVIQKPVSVSAANFKLQFECRQSQNIGQQEFSEIHIFQLLKLNSKLMLTLG